MNKILSSSAFASRHVEKSSENRVFSDFHAVVTKNYRNIPWSFDEDQMAHDLSLNAYNYLQGCLCFRFGGMTNTEMPQPVDMSDSEKAAVDFLFNQIAPRIDAMVEKKKAKADKCREAGKKGGRPKKGDVSADEKGHVSNTTEEKKGSPFSDSLKCSKSEIKDSNTRVWEKGDYRGIREEGFNHTNSSPEKKGLRRGKRGPASLPPFIPPAGLADDGEKTVFTIGRTVSEERNESTPRRTWRKSYSHFVTDLGVTWEAFRNVDTTTALLAIPCPADFDLWFPTIISAVRGEVPDHIIESWCLTGGRHDMDENRYYINYAKRERAGGITRLLLFRIYNHGFDCVGRYSKILNAELAQNTASDASSDSTHANTRPSKKNAVAASGHAVSAASVTTDAKETPVTEPKDGKATTAQHVEPPKPVVDLVPQIPPQNGIPTEDEKRAVLTEYMVNIRGLDIETIDYFGDYAGWDYRRGSWYIGMKEDGYETKRYMDVPPDSKTVDKRHPRYMVTKNAGLKNHHSEHLFAKENETVFLVEGQFDVRALWCAGCYLAVGVKNLDQLAADIQSPRLTAMNFVIVSDRDGTGESNAERWSKILAENGFASHICRLPEGFRDISEMLKKQGKAAVRRYIDNFMVEQGIEAGEVNQQESNPFLEDNWI